eukprot:COSAG02_NODE_34273_length_486_cov_1.328165_1_plen_43_part_10
MVVSRRVPLVTLVAAYNAAEVSLHLLRGAMGQCMSHVATLVPF